MSGGFTLIELIAVMVVISIMAAVAVPAFSNMTDTRTAMTARALLDDLLYAQQRAVATGTRSWVVFDAGAETWALLAEDPSNPGRVNATALTDPADGQPYGRQLDAGDYMGVTIVSLTLDGESEIGFDWLGRPFNESETELAAQGIIGLTGGHNVTIEVGTGHAAYVAP